MKLLSANLQAFVKVFRSGTVNHAAQELHLTQTAVTQRIRALEKELKITLFLRSRKGMKATPEGEALYRYCVGAENLEGAVISQIYNRNTQAELSFTLAGPTSLMSGRIVRECLPLYEKFPHLNLNFLIDDRGDLPQYLKSGKADFIIVPPHQVSKEFDSKLLKPDRYLLVATAKWKGRRLNDIHNNEKIIDFYENDSTTLNYLKTFSLDSEVKKTRLFVNDNESILQLFCAGVGYGTLSEEIARPSLKSGKLIMLNGGATMNERLALAWYPRPEKSDSIHALIHAIK